MDKIYYTYAYLRLDGTPYYIGRGKGNRATHHNHNVKVPPRERILFLKKNLTFAESVDHEKYMIFLLGRKDKGTGILRNVTDGGEGVEGLQHTEFSKSKISKSRSGMRFSLRHKERLSQSHAGVALSEKHKRRISEGLKGNKHPRWSLTEEQRREIARRYIPRSSEGNGNSAELAIEFNTTATSIRRIAKDSRWIS